MPELVLVQVRQKVEVSTQVLQLGSHMKQLLDALLLNWPGGQEVEQLVVPKTRK